MKRWDLSEDHKLRRLAATLSAWQIGQQLGRSTGAVRIRAQRIGVRLQKEGERRPGCRWSDALVEQARCLHEFGVKPAEIASRLGANIHSVRSFVYFKHRLGAAA